LEERLDFTGPLVGPELDAAYRSADVLVLPSRSETYGMVATEALARGIPVIASDVGGVPEAVGGDTPADLPGLLVRPDDPAALAVTLRRWLVQDDVRLTLRRAAGRRRATLTDWTRTARQVADVLTQVAVGVPDQRVEPQRPVDRSPQQSALIGASRRA
jgi:glycosyltransferase involved in cell wall biosynthesis